MPMCQIPKWSNLTEEEILMSLLKGREASLAGYEDILLDEFYRHEDGGLAVIGTMTEKSITETLQQLVHSFPSSFLLEQKLGQFLKNYRTILDCKRAVTGMIERCAELSQPIRLGQMDVDLVLFCNDPGNPFYLEEDRRLAEALKRAMPADAAGELLSLAGKKLTRRENARTYYRLCKALSLEIE